MRWERSSQGARKIRHQNMTRSRTACSALALLSLCIEARSQGCSDAGVCTAGPIGELQLMHDSTPNEVRHFARLRISIAAGEQSTSIVQVVPEVSIGVTERLSFQLKVPYMSAYFRHSVNG